MKPKISHSRSTDKIEVYLRQQNKDPTVVVRPANMCEVLGKLSG